MLQGIIFLLAQALLSESWHQSTLVMKLTRKPEIQHKHRDNLPVLRRRFSHGC
jgi:hypothetical protein